MDSSFSKKSPVTYKLKYYWIEKKQYNNGEHWKI